MKIRRRIKHKVSGEFIAIVEDVELVKKNVHTVMVRLTNGDVIKRKNKDVVEW